LNGNSRLRPAVKLALFFRSSGKNSRLAKEAFALTFYALTRKNF
jgi:hypothetical protein